MRRRPSRGPRRPVLTTVVLCLVVLVVLTGTVGTESAAFTVGEAPRSSSLPVSSDESAVFGLDAAPEVHVGQTDPLVNVTNRLGGAVTVTVSVAPTARDTGELVVDGTRVGNETEFLLADGNTERVSFAVENDSSLVGRDVVFAVNATDQGLTIEATNRSVPIA